MTLSLFLCFNSFMVSLLFSSYWTLRLSNQTWSWNGGGGWLMWEWGRYIFLWQWYWLCCKFKLLLEVWNTLLIFDAKHLSILCLSTSLSWISISGWWIIWFVSTQNLTQLVQLVQGRGNHFNGGVTTPYIYSIHSRVENTSRSSWERFGVVVVREVW